MGSLNSVHPADDTLVSYGLGKLDDTIAEEVGEHLEHCAACRRRVASLSADSFLGRLRMAQAPPNAAPMPPGPSIEPARLPPQSISDDQPSAPAPMSCVVPPELVDHPRHEVIRELGRGGMGVVYLARDKVMGRLEVLKVLNRDRLAQQETVERFEREIQSAAKVHHPNIVTAFDTFSVGNMLVFVMEYVEGDDLEKLVRDRGPLPIFDACYFAWQAAQGLQHAHERNMIHRDIKPGNLILSRQGNKAEIKILDFGLAKLDDWSAATTEQADEGTLTQDGYVVGTPDYIAPEQVIDPRRANIRADIYSLGCTLYHLMTGAPPFRGTVREILQAHQSVHATPLDEQRPEAPTELAAVVAKMMAKDPNQRFQTPAEVCEALRPFLKRRRVAGRQTNIRPAQTPTPSAGKTAPAAARFDSSSALALPRAGRWTLFRIIWVFATVMLMFLVAWQGGAFIVNVKEHTDRTKDLIAKSDQPTKVPKSTHDFQIGGVRIDTSPSPEELARVGIPSSNPPKQKATNSPVQKQPVQGGNDKIVLRARQPMVIGTAPHQRIGFSHDALQPVFDSDSPRFIVPDQRVAAGPLNITRLFLCREDGVPTEKNSNVFKLRPVNLWVPVKEGPLAQAVVQADDKKYRTLRSTRPLPDGVYCMHTGVLADSQPPPDFCCPFIVRGYGIPQIDTATVEIGTKDVKLNVVVRNTGEGQFNDGFLVATIQKQDGTRSEFKGRQQTRMLPISAKSQRQFEFFWKIADLKPGTYYFHGHVNYEQMWDVNTLATFDTGTFVIGGKLGTTPGQQTSRAQTKP